MKHQLPAISDLYDVTAQDFLSNFNTLDDNIMKELSHSFVRLSLTPIIESFYRQISDIPTMRKTNVILEHLDAL